MIDLEDIIRQMTANAQAMHALLQTISVEQAAWKPDPETWSMQQVMEHVYNEERIDFRLLLKEMLSDPPQAIEYISGMDCRQALDDFLTERLASIAWLQALKKPDWEARLAPPRNKINAGDVLVSWVAHDYLHIRQMNELLYAWNEKQVAPNSVQYAGGW